MANKSGSPAGVKGAGPRLERGGTPRRKSRAVPVLAGLGLALALGAAVFLIGRGRVALGARSAAGHNVLLITLDTTRADHLGCYGYGQARTPRLDGLARDGVRFARVYCPAPLTLPSHATIMTGLYPATHGVRNNGHDLAPKWQTLAETLKEPRLRHGGLRLVLFGRFPVRPGPGLRRLRRHLPAAGAAQGRQRRAPGRGDLRPVLPLAGQERRGPVLRLGPLLRSASALRPAPALPRSGARPSVRRRDRLHGPAMSERSWTPSRPRDCSRRPWSSSPATTAKASGTRSRPVTASSFMKRPSGCR